MDTRTKIVSFEEVLGIADTRELTWVTGNFDPLLAEHARRVRSFSAPERVLVVVITNPASPLLGLRARGELVAALADVDYVVLKEGPSPAIEPEDARIATEFIARVLERNRGAAI